MFIAGAEGPACAEAAANLTALALHLQFMMSHFHLCCRRCAEGPACAEVATNLAALLCSCNTVHANDEMCLFFCATGAVGPAGSEAAASLTALAMHYTNNLAF